MLMRILLVKEVEKQQWMNLISREGFLQMSNIKATLYVNGIEQVERRNGWVQKRKR
jgi:hypothetical protein